MGLPRSLRETARNDESELRLSRSLHKNSRNDESKGGAKKSHRIEFISKNFTFFLFFSSKICYTLFYIGKDISGDMYKYKDLGSA